MNFAPQIPHLWSGPLTPPLQDYQGAERLVCELRQAAGLCGPLSAFPPLGHSQRYWICQNVHLPGLETGGCDVLLSDARLRESHRSKGWWSPGVYRRVDAGQGEKCKSTPPQQDVSKNNRQLLIQNLVEPSEQTRLLDLSSRSGSQRSIQSKTGLFLSAPGKQELPSSIPQSLRSNHSHLWESRLISSVTSLVGKE